ncbi:MAG TPA: hypothetical protein VMT52_11230 [Planctomycetota bacterium]|nr:hypothetical protein [Planctomycetota bacterium]
MLQVLWIALILAATLAAVLLRDWIPVLAGGLIVAAGAVWVLVSVLSPSSPDRRCPRCGKEGLVKIRRGVPGVRCELCEFRDEAMHVSYLDDW